MIRYIFTYLTFSLLLCMLNTFNLQAQCGASCTYCFTSSTGDNDDNFNLNNGETLCIDATSEGTLNIDYDEVILNGNASIIIDGSNTDTVFFNAELNFNSGGNLIINNGNIKYTSGDLEYEYAEWENYGHMNVAGRFIQNSNGTPEFNNHNSANLTVNDQLAINNGSFNNQGTVHVMNGDFDLNSGSALNNSGTITSSGKLSVNDNTTVDLTGGILDVNDLTINGGDFTAGTNDECGAIMVQGITQLNNGANVISGDIQLTDEDGNVDVNNCGGGDCNFNITNDNTCFDVLPVNWYNFTAYKKQGRNLLKWTTLNEVNNDYFVIEKSKDGENFYPIGQEEGAGTAFHKNRYRFTDAEANGRAYYYRIKQVDYDGQYDYSETRYVSGSANHANHVRIFPNPASEILNVESNQKIQTVYWINSMGHTVRTEDLSGSGSNKQHTFDISTMPASMYYVKIVHAGYSVLNKKIVIE